MVLKKRVLFTLFLILVFCLTAILPVTAVQLTAKDLMLTAINNLDLGINEAFYQKSQGQGTMKITRFNGSLVEAIGDYSGSALNYDVVMDDTQNAMKISFAMDLKDATHTGDIYFKDDQIIFTKDVFQLLQNFGLDILSDHDLTWSGLPNYLYLADPQFNATWEQMSSYQKGQLPDEYTELLAFLIEAIPDSCFTLTASKVSIQLDQETLTDTIINLVTKIKTEGKRIADILMNLNQYTYQQLGMDPAEMKQEMIAGMESITIPSKEEIQAVTSFIEINDFTFEYPLLPGGPKTLNIDLGFKSPDGSLDGAFSIALDIAGKKDNLKGTYNITGQFNTDEGPKVEFTCNSNYSYTDIVGLGDTNIDIKVEENLTGELLLDLGLTTSSETKVNPDLKLDIPQLDANNSLDISDLIPSPGELTVVEQPNLALADFNLVVNDVALEGKVRIGSQGELALPARAVLQELGYQVQWLEPNEVQIIGEDQIISLFINSNDYIVNGSEENTWPSAPYMEAGTTMIPMSFLTELGIQIDFAEQNILINN